MKKRIAVWMLALAAALALGANAVTTGETAERAESAALPVFAAAEGESAPDAAETLSFADLDARMRESYYPILALEENIQTLEEWDYKRTEDELRDALNKTADAQWAGMGGSSGNLAALNANLAAALTADPTNLALQASSAALQASTAATSAVGSLASQQLQVQYDAYRDAYDDIRSGKTQSDNEGVKRQLHNLQDQTVIVGESLYLTLKELETRDAALTRTIAALERTEKELALRLELGQVSALAARQVSTGRAQAESARATLRMNMDNVLLQLKAMAGMRLDEALTLGALPSVAAEQLAAMELDADLSKAKGVSYELYDAKKTLDDAKKAYDDALKKYGASSKKNEWMQAKHTWQAAQYTYENALQSYELKFRALYAQVKDAAQAADAARVSLAGQEAEYAAAALKHEQGNLSANALTDAADTLAEAKDAVADAERALLTQYRAYQWAVGYGILNG